MNANLLISWSKKQSEIVASALHGWIPTVVPGIAPWMSKKDIEKGRQWFDELQNVLAEVRLCIICVTPENVRSPWIYYETGAIATRGQDVRVYPYLVGLSPNMIADGPLGKWQCTVAERDDTWELVKALNSNGPSEPHHLSVLEGNFAARWPSLEERLRPVLEADAVAGAGFVVSHADELAGVRLSSEARTMIVEASKDPSGSLLFLQTLGGTMFQANDVNMCPDQSPRTVARWRAALETLVEHRMLGDHKSNGSQFELTDRGWEIADALQGPGAIVKVQTA